MRQYKQSQYNYHIKVGDRVVLHNFLTKALIETSPVYYDRLNRIIAHPNSQRSMDHELFLLLRSQGFIVPSHLDEIDVIEYRYYSSMFGEGANQLTLVIFQRCGAIFVVPIALKLDEKNSWMIKQSNNSSSSLITNFKTQSAYMSIGLAENLCFAKPQ